MSGLPRFVKQALMPAFHYAQRLRFWGMVIRDTRPVDGPSRAILRKSILAAPLTAFGRFGGWENPQILGDARLAVKGYGTFDCRERMDDLFHILPQAQPGVRATIEKYLKPGMTFVDAGANIGFFTIVGAKLAGADGHVICVEMIPETAAILRRHIDINQLTNVTVVEKALSDHAGGQVTAHLPVDHVGQASLIGESVSGITTREITVPTTTLDEITADFDTIDLMKIDLEGAESLALAGAQTMLGKVKRVIFEARPDDPGVDATVAALKAAGFSIRPIDKYNQLAHR